MDDLLNLHIGQRLRARRRALGLTQSDLAAMVGMRFRQIHKYECAENRTSAATLWKLACALNVSIPYFFDGWCADPTLDAAAPPYAAAPLGRSRWAGPAAAIG